MTNKPSSEPSSEPSKLILKRVGNDPLVEGIEKIFQESPTAAYSYIIALMLRQAGGKVEIDYVTLKEVASIKLFLRFRHDKERMKLVVESR